MSLNSLTCEVHEVEDGELANSSSGMEETERLEKVRMLKEILGLTEENARLNEETAVRNKKILRLQEETAMNNKNILRLQEETARLNKRTAELSARQDFFPDLCSNKICTFDTLISRMEACGYEVFKLPLPLENYETPTEVRTSRRSATSMSSIPISKLTMEMFHPTARPSVLEMELDDVAVESLLEVKLFSGRRSLMRRVIKEAAHQYNFLRNFLIQHTTNTRVYWLDPVDEVAMQRIFRLFIEHLIRSSQLDACEVRDANEQLMLSASIRVTSAGEEAVFKSLQGHVDLVVGTRSLKDLSMEDYGGHVEVKWCHGALRGMSRAPRIQLVGQNLCVRAVLDAQRAVVSLLTDVLVMQSSICCGGVHFIEAHAATPRGVVLRVLLLLCALTETEAEELTRQALVAKVDYFQPPDVATKMGSKRKAEGAVGIEAKKGEEEKEHRMCFDDTDEEEEDEDEEEEESALL